MPLTYFRWAVPGYYGTARVDAARYHWLDGLAFLPEGDRAMVRWLDENAQGRPAILESDGENYSKHGRISIQTQITLTTPHWSMTVTSHCQRAAPTPCL